jgi:spoIIIJ-associated protein
MKRVETEGDSIDAAIAAALELLGVTRDQVDVEILASPSRGLFGIGSRKARVRATPRPGSQCLESGTMPASPRADDSASPAESGRAVEPTDDEAIVERARDVLQEIVHRVGVEASVTASTSDNHISLEIIGDSSGILIGRRGQMLDALEYVVTRIVSRDEGATTRISVDSANYRSRRREALESLARRMALQAKKKRKQVALNPMSPRDRRIVHLALQDDRSLTTRSSGKGYYRRLIIVPERASGSTPEH